MSRRRVFVTGADTLIGSRILDQLLVYDVSVRAVVGSHGQVNILRQQYPPTSYPWLEIAIVPTRDLSLPNAFDDALRDHPEPFDTIIHAVADHSGDADCLTQFIALQSEYLLNLLRSVHSVTSRVHRVVLTTSLSPFARWLVEPDPGPYSPYNSAPQRAAEVDPEYILATSQASENLVYNRIWEWIRQTHARFELVYVTAPSVYGPTLRPLENSSDLQEANRRIWNICSNDARERMTSPPYGIDYYTDVRDLALATVQAAFAAQAGNRRFTISAGLMPPGRTIAEFLISRLPELTGRVNSDGSPTRRPLSGHSVGLSNTQYVGSILGLVNYRRLEDTLTEVAQQILELQRRRSWRSIIQS